MNVTQRLRTLEQNGNLDKLKKFLEQVKRDHVDLKAWEKRFNALLNQLGIKFHPNHEDQQKYINGNEYGLSTPSQGATWSGKDEIPKIGDRVRVKINGFGMGTVRGYFVESGDDTLYQGVYIQPDLPPAFWLLNNWFQQQQCGNFFGVEIAN